MHTFFFTGFCHLVSPAIKKRMIVKRHKNIVVLKTNSKTSIIQTSESKIFEINF